MVNNHTYRHHLLNRSNERNQDIVYLQLSTLGYTVVEFEKNNEKLETAIEIDKTEISNNKYKLSFKDGHLNLIVGDRQYLDLYPSAGTFTFIFMSSS